MRLATVDLLDRPPLLSGVLYELILRRGYICVYIYKEVGTHNRPHFHIRFKGEFNASYDIESCVRLAGAMPRKYEQPILEWAANSKDSLLQVWDHLNDGDRRAIEFEGDDAA